MLCKYRFLIVICGDEDGNFGNVILLLFVYVLSRRVVVIVKSDFFI